LPYWICFKQGRSQEFAIEEQAGGLGTELVPQRGPGAEPQSPVGVWVLETNVHLDIENERIWISSKQNRGVFVCNFSLLLPLYWSRQFYRWWQGICTYVPAPLWLCPWF